MKTDSIVMLPDARSSKPGWLRRTWRLLADLFADANTSGPRSTAHADKVIGTGIVSLIFLVVSLLGLIDTVSGGHVFSWEAVSAIFAIATALALSTMYFFVQPTLADRLEDRKRALSLEAEAASKRICAGYDPDALTLGIAELETELLGDGSRYAAILKRVREQNIAARILSCRFEVRLTENNAEFLRRSRDDMERLVERSGETIERLADYHAKVTAFLAECRDTVSRIEPSLRDLELVREAGRLTKLAPELECEAVSVIEDGAARLRTRMLGVRTLVEERFGERQIPLSDLFAYNPEPAREHDGFRALAELESRIETFDPGSLREIA